MRWVGGGQRLPGLRAARLARALSQRELAIRANMARTTIGYLEANERGAHPATVGKLAAALGVTPATLYRAPEEA